MDGHKKIIYATQLEYTMHSEMNCIMKMELYSETIE